MELSANDVITFNFVEDKVENIHHNPTFTHQIFEDEAITFLENPETRIIVNVNCRDLSHTICSNFELTPDETDRLFNGLKVALPCDATWIGNVDIKSHMASPRGSLNPQGLSLRPGKLVHEFDIFDESFEIRLANHHDPGATDLLKRGEKLAMWFIETADSVDFEDDRWEVLFLFRKANGMNKKTTRSSEVCYFCGYFTLFTFRNPFTGSKLRICQALVLPNHQGKGLGREMILAVYRLARQREDIAEVSVEDPAPGFQRLRDSVDCEWLQAVQSSLMHAADISKCSTESSAGSRFGSRAMADATTDKTVVQSHQAAEKSLRSGAFKDCARILKITIQQATFAVEALRYCRIGEDEEIGEIEDTDEDDDGSVAECEALRRFRLDVKRRLLAQNEGLKAMDKENKQRRLESLYREELTRFKAARRHYRRLKRSKENCLLTAARQLTADATAGAADAADAADTAAGVAAGVATADDSIRSDNSAGGTGHEVKKLRRA